MYPKADRIRLKNGLILLHCGRGQLPLVSINGFVRAGKDQNPNDLPGLASLTSRLLDEGSRKFSSQDISKLLENRGGELTTFSEREATGVCFHLGSEDLGLGIELLAEMLVHPTFPEDRFELERQKVLSHIRAIQDDPETVGSQALNSWVYRGSPLAEPILGSERSVRKITVPDLRRFHQRKYGPQNTIIVVVGNADLEATIRFVKARFADWENHDSDLGRLPELTRQQEPYFDTRPMPKEQTTIFMGHLGIPRSNPDFYTLQIVDTVLGGGSGFTSRIPRELRDNQGLAYTAYSDITSSSGVYPGRFAAYICTSPENQEKARQGMLREIEGLLEKGLSEEELETAKSFLTGNFVFEFQGNANIARYLLSREIFRLEEDYPDRYRKHIARVTRSEALRVARRYLDTINYTTVVAGSV